MNNSLNGPAGMGPFKSSFLLKEKSFKCIYSFIPEGQVVVCLASSCDALKSSFFLSQCKVLRFFIMVQISSETMHSLVHTLHFLTKLQIFQVFLFCLLLSVSTIAVANVASKKVC